MSQFPSVNENHQNIKEKSKAQTSYISIPERFTFQDNDRQNKYYIIRQNNYIN